MKKEPAMISDLKIEWLVGTLLIGILLLNYVWMGA